MTEKGMTLVELLVVLAIVGILVIALGFEFAGWQGGYKIEKTIKEIYSDLMDARSRAMQFNREYFVQLVNGTSYTMVEDTNDNYAMDEAAVPTFPKTTEYSYTFNGAAPAGQIITFNKKGMISTWTTIDTIAFASTLNPDYNCITIGQTQINMGEWTTVGCRAK